LLPCGSIHTFGMREAIDVAFIDKHGLVLKAVCDLQPRHILVCKGAVVTLERRSKFGSSWFVPGDNIILSI
jgi:uncharacterized membrane protein (UPF0127 family)